VRSNRIWHMLDRLDGQAMRELTRMLSFSLFLAALVFLMWSSK
jgi:hypothetical protein